jgi:uncharacterized membrane protein
MPDDEAGCGPVVGTGGRSALIRVLTSFVLGAATFAIAVAVVPWQVAVLLGWDVIALTFLGLVWAAVARKDGADTAELASAEDASRVAADAILIAATIVSLLLVGLVLVNASGQRGATRIGSAVVAVVSLMLSWAAIQVVYTLRYAHLYYGHAGGIDFNGDQAPDYGDFAYVAFTIGMTYQVSDTSITSKAIRTAALWHALLSFLFSIGVVATSVNLVADLLRP